MKELIQKHLTTEDVVYVVTLGFCPDAVLFVSRRRLPFGNCNFLIRGYDRGRDELYDLDRFIACDTLESAAKTIQRIAQILTIRVGGGKPPHPFWS